MYSFVLLDNNCGKPLTDIARTTHNNQRLSIESLHQPLFLLSRTPPSHPPVFCGRLKPRSAHTMDLTSLSKMFFSSFHSVLRTNITPCRISSHHHRERAVRACQRRYKHLRQPTPWWFFFSSDNEINKESESEKHAGMRCVDFLMGYTKFLV